MKGIIYKYTNLINGKSYIGQTVHPAARKSQHKSSAFNKLARDYDCPFHRAVRRYGWDAFKYEVLYSFDLEPNMLFNTLNIMEIRMIDLYKPKYNATKGGKSFKFTEEVKQKISKTTKGRTPWNKGKTYKKDGFKVGQFTKDGVLINTFYSCGDAARYLGKKPIAICRCCNGQRKSCGGYRWQYV